MKQKSENYAIMPLNKIVNHVLKKILKKKIINIRHGHC